MKTNVLFKLTDLGGGYPFKVGRRTGYLTFWNQNGYMIGLDFLRDSLEGGPRRFKKGVTSRG